MSIVTETTSGNFNLLREMRAEHTLDLCVSTISRVFTYISAFAEVGVLKIQEGPHNSLLTVQY